jgi:hypothetical protein
MDKKDMETLLIWVKKEASMINRELHEEFGHCCSGGSKFDPDVFDDEGICKLCGECWDAHSIPDYVADPRLVIREVETEKGRLKKFVGICWKRWMGETVMEHPEFSEYMIFLIAIDDTGKLATLARDWLKGEG